MGRASHHARPAAEAGVPLENEVNLLFEYKIRTLTTLHG
jgi:hypothetical protein